MSKLFKALTAGLALAVGTAGVVLAAPGSRADGTVVLAGSRSPYTFTVAGTSVRQLHPGATRKTRLTLVNPYGHALVVTSLRGEVVSSSRKQCAPTRRNIRVQPYAGTLPFRLPGRTTRTVGAIPVVMPLDASAKCARTTFVIRLSGTAGRAG